MQILCKVIGSVYQSDSFTLAQPQLLENRKANRHPNKCSMSRCLLLGVRLNCIRHAVSFLMPLFFCELNLIFLLPWSFNFDDKTILKLQTNTDLKH